jgi:hypothetical protein
LIKAKSLRFTQSSFLSFTAHKHRRTDDKPAPAKKNKARMASSGSSTNNGSGKSSENSKSIITTTTTASPQTILALPYSLHTIVAEFLWVEEGSSLRTAIISLPSRAFS